MLRPAHWGCLGIQLALIALERNRAGEPDPLMSIGEAAWGDRREPGTGQRQFPGSEAELSSPGGSWGFS